MPFLPRWRRLDLEWCQELRGGQDDPVSGERVRPLGEVRVMLDLFYVGIVVLFFVGCVAFVKACDRL
jgi:hypothetical protein